MHSENTSVISVFKNIQVVISIIGVIFNTLSICVFRRKRLKKHTYSVYWTFLAFFETIILLHTFRHWAKYFLNFNIDLISPFFCRFNEYQPFVSGIISLGLQSLIIFDRYLTIVHPNRFKIIKKLSVQILLVSSIVVYSLLLNILLPLNYRLVQVNGTNLTFVCRIPNQIFKIHSTIHVIHFFIFNLIVNNIIDVSVIYHIMATRGAVRRFNRFTNIDRQFAITAITINLSSLIFRTPLVVGNYLSAHLSPEKKEMIFTICLTVTLFDKSDIFIINLLVNSLFRREFLLIFAFDRTKNSNMNMNIPRRGIFPPSERVELLQRPKFLTL